MTLVHDLAALYRRDLIRLRQELAAFDDEAGIWKTVPGVTNSAGHLALHLEGNLREYIGRQLGGIEYQRNRPAEFQGPPKPKQELVAAVAELATLVPGVIENLNAGVLDAPSCEKPALSTRQFLIHLYGHLSYHLGQIDYLRRVVTGAGAIDLAQLP